MDMYNTLSTHDVIQICVKSEHVIYNASITKSFENMPYLEGGAFTYRIGNNNPKIILSNQHQVVSYQNFPSPSPSHVP
jgi:hypothetical protein